MRVRVMVSAIIDTDDDTDVGVMDALLEVIATTRPGDVLALESHELLFDDQPSDNLSEVLAKLSERDTIAAWGGHRPMSAEYTNGLCLACGRRANECGHAPLEPDSPPYRFG